MKKKIVIIGTMAILLFGAYILGTTQAKTEIIIKEVNKYIEVIPDGYINIESEEFYNNYIDMRTVTEFTTNNNSLQLYLKDGSGYYLER